MTARVTWDAGDGGALGVVEGLRVTVRASARAYPPGASAKGTLSAEGGAHAFTLKVAGSKREDDGFVVRGRLVSATSAVIAAFAECGEKVRPREG